MSIKECRRYIRHPFCLPLSYIVVKPKTKKAKDPEEKRSNTVNISLGGLLFLGKTVVESEARLIIKMPFENKVFNVKGKVVRCTQKPDTKLYEIAVCFTRSQEAFKAKMIEQIYLISEYRDILSLQLAREVSIEEASRVWIKKYSERFSKLYW